jgi:hypothetical protein
VVGTQFSGPHVYHTPPQEFVKCQVFHYPLPNQMDAGGRDQRNCSTNTPETLEKMWKELESPWHICPKTSGARNENSQYGLIR